MAFNFFYIKTDNTSKFLGNESINYPVAVKTGDGVLDVHGSFRWKNTGNVDEVPKICLTEYKLNYGTWVANLARLWTNITSNNTNSIKGFLSKATFGDPYQNLYIGEQTGFYYNLPYLKNSGSIRGDNFSNSWGEKKSLIQTIGDTFAPQVTKLINDIGENVIGGLTGQGWGAEKLWKYIDSNARSVTISFPLYNTYSLKEANDNFSFVNLFAFQNMKTRTSYMTFLPPKVYVVDTMDDGGIYMPIAYVADFKVESLGTLRKMSDFGTATNGLNTTGYRMIPEAYKVTIVMKELIPESTNIMQGVLGQNKVQVIGNPQSVRVSTQTSNPTYNLDSFGSNGTVGSGIDVTPVNENVVSVSSTENSTVIPKKTSETQVTPESSTPPATNPWQENSSSLLVDFTSRLITIEGSAEQLQLDTLAQIIKASNGSLTAIIKEFKSDSGEKKTIFEVSGPKQFVNDTLDKLNLKK